MAGKLNFDSNSLLNLKFEKNVKGYDAYQVDVTLDQILADYRFYESFYTEAKQYIAELENRVKKQNDELRKKDVEIAKISNRLGGINNRANVSQENMNLLKRIDLLERALYKKGVDPTKIK